MCQFLLSLSHNTRNLLLKQQLSEYIRCVRYSVAAISPASISLSLALVRSVLLVLTVELATDRNQLSRPAFTEDTLATTGTAAALSVQTCAIGIMCAPAPLLL